MNKFNDDLHKDLFALFIRIGQRGIGVTFSSEIDEKELSERLELHTMYHFSLDWYSRDIMPEQYEARVLKGTLRLLTTDDNFIVGMRGRPEGVHNQKILITVVEE